MSKRKIIIIGTAYPYRGGLAAFNERLAAAYIKHGDEVEIFTFTLQYPNLLFPGKSQYSVDPPPKGLIIHRKINSINPFNWIKVGRQIRKMKPDVVIFAYWMWFFAPCFSAIARFARSKQTKFIGFIHNMLPHEPSLLDKIIPKLFISKMDSFVAMAKSVTNDINRFDKKNKLKVISPHPIYDHYGEKINTKDALNQLGLDTNYHYILFFGIIRAYKGLDLLIEAFAKLRKCNDEVKLIVVGEFYEDREKYISLINAHNLENDIILKDEFIPDSEVNVYFGACDIVAQPYRSATQSGVTQIAYHFEKSMLVTNVGGLAEIVPDKKVGYVVNPNPDEIADALKDFFDNNRQEEFEKNILVEKEKYSWENMIEAINAL